MDDAAGRNEPRPSEAMEGERDPRTVAHILSDIVTDFRSLMRDEIALAKAEFRQAIDKVVSGATLTGIGAFLAMAGLNALVASAVLALALIWAPWLAALAVGLAVLLLGGVLAMVGIRNLRSAELLPQRTVRTMRDDVRTVKGEAP